MNDILYFKASECFRSTNNRLVQTVALEDIRTVNSIIIPFPQFRVGWRAIDGRPIQVRMKGRPTPKSHTIACLSKQMADQFK